MAEEMNHDLLKGRVEALERENAQLRQENERLREENRRWARLAGTDDLTGLPNRITFLRAIVPNEIRRALSGNDPISFAMLAADDLGQINEKYGRSVGDEVIKQLAGYLKSILKENEKLGHIDGTNFAVIMYGTDIQEAQNQAGKWRAQIRSRSFSCGDESVQITVSAGICSIRRSEITDPRLLTELVFKRLNETLYTAKKEGGNRVELYPVTEIKAAERKQE